MRWRIAGAPKPAPLHHIFRGSLFRLTLRRAKRARPTEFATIRRVGDWFQVIADVDATEEEAPRLAADVLSWLVATGIVSAERTDCVLGAPLGNPPGLRYETAVNEPDERLRTLWTNGVEVFAGATVVDAGQGADDDLVCPHCAAESSYEDPQWQTFQSGIESWHAGGRGDVTCVQCGRTAAVGDWSKWAFGRVGIRFWNWPPLRDDFVAETARRLGHRVRLVDGKL
jgi:hypothetical protein